jgi:hypothetical protein
MKHDIFFYNVETYAMVSEIRVKNLIDEEFGKESESEWNIFRTLFQWGGQSYCGNAYNSLEELKRNLDSPKILSTYFINKSAAEIVKRIISKLQSSKIQIFVKMVNRDYSSYEEYKNEVEIDVRRIEKTSKYHVRMQAWNPSSSFVAVVDWENYLEVFPVTNGIDYNALTNFLAIQPVQCFKVDLESKLINTVGTHSLEILLDQLFQLQQWLKSSDSNCYLEGIIYWHNVVYDSMGYVSVTSYDIEYSDHEVDEDDVKYSIYGNKRTKYEDESDDDSDIDEDCNVTQAEIKQCWLEEVAKIHATRVKKAHKSV